MQEINVGRESAVGALTELELGGIECDSLYAVKVARPCETCQDGGLHGVTSRSTVK